MNETDYWESLEFRVCQAFRAMPEQRLQYLWCDGFIPNNYQFNDLHPKITGQVWICKGQQQNQWSFTLLLPRSFSSLDEIDWSVLLPSDGSIQWMLLDEDNHSLQIDLATL